MTRILNYFILSAPFVVYGYCIVIQLHGHKLDRDYLCENIKLHYCELLMQLSVVLCYIICLFGLFKFLHWSDSLKYNTILLSTAITLASSAIFSIAIIDPREDYPLKISVCIFLSAIIFIVSYLL